jgi:hypothetical protein
MQKHTNSVGFYYYWPNPIADKRFHAQIGERHRKGAYAGREAEWARQEADIFAAQREGRVQGTPCQVSKQCVRGVLAVRQTSRVRFRANQTSSPTSPNDRV